MRLKKHIEQKLNEIGFLKIEYSNEDDFDYVEIILDERRVDAKLIFKLAEILETRNFKICASVDGWKDVTLFEKLKVSIQILPSLIEDLS